MARDPHCATSWSVRKKSFVRSLVTVQGRYRTECNATAFACMSPFGTSATNFSLGPDVSLRDEAEVGRAAEFAVSVENDPISDTVLRASRNGAGDEIAHTCAQARTGPQSNVSENPVRSLLRGFLFFMASTTEPHL